MYRFTVALVLLISSTAASWAQSPSPFDVSWLRPSIWKTQQGAVLKILSINSATGDFSGVFISSPSGPCPTVNYDVAGRIRGDRVVFQTTRGGPSDCALTVLWSGRAVSPGTVATRWTIKFTAPNGPAVAKRGREIFQRV